LDQDCQTKQALKRVERAIEREKQGRFSALLLETLKQKKLELYDR